MKKTDQKLVDQTIIFLKAKMDSESTGHDWYHVERVWKLSKQIAVHEAKQHDELVLELGALLHDIADWKFYDGDLDEGPKQAEEWLKKINADEATIRKVKNIIKKTSFKGAGVKTNLNTVEEKIVHDADKLDAIGAIGIARTFAYGGHRGRPIYDPRLSPKEHKTFAQYKANSKHTVNHFYEKLLLLKDRMETKSGKKLAESRHNFMELYLKEFYDEWEGIK